MIPNLLSRSCFLGIFILFFLISPRGWAQKPVTVKAAEKTDETKQIAAPAELPRSGTSENQATELNSQVVDASVSAPQPTTNFKSNKKSTLETGINLSDSVSVVMPYLRYRYFLNKTWALRGHFQISHQKETSFYFDSKDNFGTNIQSSFSFVGDIGVEYHLTGTKRLSPYFGVYAGIGGGANRETWKDYYDGALNIDSILPQGYVYGFNYSGVTPNFRFVVGSVAGFDYYLTERIYAGLELGWNFQISNQGRGEYTWDFNGIREGKGFLDNQFKFSSSGFAAQPTVRVGWRF